MKEEDVAFLLGRFAEQLDELQIETAALGTAVRALLDVAPDKEAFASRFRQVMSASKAESMTAQELSRHQARHDALLKRLGLPEDD